MRITRNRLREIARWRANQEDNNLCRDPEVNYYLDLGAQELYSYCVRSSEFIKPVALSITANGTGTYDVPEMLSLVSVQTRNTILPSLVKRVHPGHIGRYTNENHRSDVPTGYHLQRSLTEAWKLLLYPVGYTGTIDVRYIPVFPGLTDEASYLNSVNGWEEYVTISAAIRMIIREAGNPQMLVIERDRVLDRILKELEIADSGQDPSRMDNYFDPAADNIPGTGYIDGIVR